MASIKAIGEHNGIKLEVNCSDDSGEIIIDFNGFEEERLESEFNELLEKDFRFPEPFHRKRILWLMC